MTNIVSRKRFPSADVPVVTDAGLETWLVFDKGIELPAFAAYPLAGTDTGRAVLTEYYSHYVDIAMRSGAALVLEAPTWRANPDWAATLGHDRDTLRVFIEQAVDVVDALRHGWESDQPYLVGGAVGPRGDGYRIDVAMSADEAQDYHSFQMGCLAATPADVATAMTLCYTDEAIGISRAAKAAGLPVVLSFTVEIDGRLPSGMSIADAIEVTDGATEGYPTHYMINCAHPTHFDHALGELGPLASRIGAVRANASTLSHAELDEAEELDSGDPVDLAARYVALKGSLPALHVVGGCCGTDHRHVEAIAEAFVG
jgi:homocysteine S-methyltransferase